jgi:hypothetical protein
MEALDSYIAATEDEELDETYDSDEDEESEEDGYDSGW